MTPSVKRRFAAFLILLAVSACDNVEWGGVDVHLDPPETEADTLAAAEEAAEAEDPVGPSLPRGPALFAAIRDEPNRVTLHPVAEVGPDRLTSLVRGDDPAAFWDLFAGAILKPGAAFTLFAEGSRVGTVRVDSVEFEAGRCGPVPVAAGMVELIPDAAEATRFVALPEGSGLPQSFGAFRPQEHDYDQRVAGLGMVTDAIGQVGAAWPQRVLDTRADMQAIPLDGDRTGAFAGTFLFQDALRVGPSLTDAAWSIFVLGTSAASGYDLAFMDYRPVAEGKAAPRFFEQGDWDEDGRTELLLEIFGQEARWWAALDRRDGRWVKVFDSSCGSGN